MFKRLFSKPTPLTIDTLAVAPTDTRDYGPCECCGNFSRLAWGDIYHQQVKIAEYYVHWTLNNPKHGANFDLVVGKWGGKASEKDRETIALLYHHSDGRSGFMVIDAADRPAGQPEFAKTALSREQVVGTPLAADAFAMVDAIWLHDPRIAEVQGWLRP